MNDPYINNLREFFKNNSFVPDESTRLSQKICLKLFEELSEICEYNSIRYWAICGTLLGAVRHEGFIPWDDDLDLMMPRSDIDKLKKSIDRGKHSLMKSYSGMFKFRSLGGAGFIDIFPCDLICYSDDKNELRRMYSDIFTMKNSILENNDLKNKNREERHIILDYLSTIPRLLNGSE